MALSTVYYHSQILAMASNITVAVPNDPKGDVPLVTLLSPEGREARWWFNVCPLEQFADAYNTAFIAVPARQGAHLDMKYGYAFFKELSQGIPKLVERFLPILNIRESKRYAAGASIGALGAFKLALLEPGVYTAAASLSGLLDVGAMFRNPAPDNYFTEKRMKSLFGTPEDIPGSENDLNHLAEQAASSAGKKPAFYLSAYKPDAGYEASKAFYARFNGKLAMTWVEETQPELWGEQLKNFLKWISGTERR